MAGTDSTDKEFADIYRMFYKKMFGICLNYVRNEVIAQDLVQDSFIIVIEKLPTLKDKSKIEPWIAAIVKNACINYLRKKSLFTDIIIDDIADKVSDDPTPSREQEKTISYSAMADMVEKLPEGYKKVFKLAVFEGMSHKEIAELLNISPTASASQLSRAKERLRRMIKSYWSVTVLFLPVIMFLLFKFHTAKKSDYNIVSGQYKEYSHNRRNENRITDENILSYSAASGVCNEVSMDTFTVLPKTDSVFLQTETVEKESATDNYMPIDMYVKDSSFTSKDSDLSFDYMAEYTLVSNDWTVSTDFSLQNVIGQSNQSSLNEMIRINNNEEEDPDSSELFGKMIHYRPVSVSVRADKRISKHFSLGCGLTYSVLKSEIIFDSVGNIDYNLQYLGAGVKVLYNYYDNGRFAAQISLGGSFEVPVHHKMKLNLADINEKQNLDAHLQFDCSVSLRLSYKLTDRTGIFIEPVLNYYIPNGDKFSAYRSLHRYDFALPIGVFAIF